MGGLFFYGVSIKFLPLQKIMFEKHNVCET
jgi:hypothetical protein